MWLSLDQNERKRYGDGQVDSNAHNMILNCQVDKDNSGRLSLDAFMQLMANKMAEKDTKEEIMKVLW